MAALPHYASGEIVKGFGRGSKSLGIPTANFPKEVVDALPNNLETGVYYGFAQVKPEKDVYKMVMSIGWNPFFKNKQKTMETHVLHQYSEELYGRCMKVVLLGYLRPQSDFPSLEHLIKAINDDIKNASDLLDQDKFAFYKNDEFFK